MSTELFQIPPVRHSVSGTGDVVVGVASTSPADGVPDFRIVQSTGALELANASISQLTAAPRTRASAFAAATPMGRERPPVGGAPVEAYCMCSAGRGRCLRRAPSSELLAFAELGHERLSTRAYDEPFSKTNPFEAHASAALDTLSLAKLGSSYNLALTPKLSLGVRAAAVWGFSASTDLQASVPGIGVLTPARFGTPVWAEYGARIGYALTPRATVELIADGVAGGDRVGSETHIGADLRLTF